MWSWVLEVPYFQHMRFTMNFEWFMRIVSTSHFDWVAIPHTVFEGVVASTVGTKDPLSSDECSSSGWSKPYPQLSVSKINAVCMLSLLWVRSGMSSIHVCVVYFIRTQDSVVIGVGSTLLPAYVLSLWILNGLWGLWPLLTLIELPSLIKFGRSVGIHCGD